MSSLECPRSCLRASRTGEWCFVVRALQKRGLEAGSSCVQQINLRPDLYPQRSPVTGECCHSIQAQGKWTCMIFWYRPAICPSLPYVLGKPWRQEAEPE